MRRNNLPTVAVSLGDMNGIGPEILLRILSETSILNDCNVRVHGNHRLFRETDRKIFSPPVMLTDLSEVNGSITIRSSSTVDEAHRTITFIPLESDAELFHGKVDVAMGALAGEAIRSAVRDLQEGNAEAIVTLPISKENFRQAGNDWPGHTEMISELTNGAPPLMILMCPELRVGLLTIHVPLSEVSRRISEGLIEETLLRFHQSLVKDFAVAKPRIALLGLNPHAGESGEIGREEVEMYRPAVQKVRSILAATGATVAGPFPADGFFARYRPEDFDGVLASYHDQGLIPLKMMAQGAGVNVTAGLPIVRTSPDHGTAFQIAGQGIADHRSTLDAMRTALEIVTNRRNATQSQISTDER